jgi:hypothetical protein
MTIKSYLKKNNLTMAEFCRKNKFPYHHIRHIKQGRSRPSPELALRIEKATGGKVDRLELLYPHAKW